MDLITAGLAGALSGGAGEASGIGHGWSALLGGEGLVNGHLLAPSIYHGAADIAARAATNPLGQRYLKNQGWRPGPHSTASRDDLVRALLAPPNRDSVTSK
jgi:hypothetical protein